MDRLKNIIFISGIHGVGKTSFCKRLSQELLIDHYSASELISKVKSIGIRENKIVNNIENNQKALSKAVHEFLDSNRYYLLDGHFCLINSSKKIEKIPIDIFEDISIKEIIVLVDEIDRIANRLEKRDSKQYELGFIKEFQEKEVMHAKEIASEINVNCKVFNLSNDEKEIIECIRSIV